MLTGRLRHALPFAFLALPGAVLPATAQDPAPALPADTAPRVGARVVRSWKHPGSSVSTVAFSPDGRFVMSAGGDGNVMLWDRDADEPVRVIRAHTDGIVAASFTPDGRQILTAGSNGTVGRWETNTGNPVRILSLPAKPQNGMAFSRDGRFALSIVQGCPVQWNLEDGEALPFEGPRYSSGGVAISPDGRIALTSHRCSSTLFVWSVEAGALLRLRKLTPGAVQAMGFSPDGALVTTVGYSGRLILWDMASVEPRHTIEIEGRSQYSRVVFTPDSSAVLVGTRNAGSSRLYEAASGRLLGAWDTSGMATAELSPGGRDIVVGQTDGNILVWRTGPEAAATEAGREERRDRLGDALEDFGQPDVERWVRARETAIGLGDGAVGAILQTWPPDPAEPVLSEADLDRRLIDLDDDSFEVRVRARRALIGQGDRIVPWLDAQQKRAASLSAEMQTALVAVRESNDKPPLAEMGSTGRFRAVMALVEMPRTDTVLRALSSYATGPPESSAAGLARQALRR
jgi:WD40 repeat protein